VVERGADRIHPGRHAIDIQVNGRILGSVDLEVVDPRAGGHGVTVAG
jgi:hypothetical protein